jgi:PAS domain S-box-containing protein
MLRRLTPPSLRTKTLLSISVTLMLLLLALTTIAAMFLPPRFAALEAQHVRHDVEHVRVALRDKLDALQITVEDWAAWDESYHFVEDGNAAYVAANLPDQTFADLQLNLIVYVHRSGRIVFGKTFDLQRQQSAPLLPSLAEQLRPNSPLLRHEERSGATSGLLLLPEGTLLVATHPILTNADAGPARGTLLMGRWLDAAELSRLAQLTGHPVSIVRLDQPLSDELQAVQAALSVDDPLLVRSLDSARVAGYRLLSDITGAPNLVVRVEQPRAIAQQGQVALVWLVLALVTAGLVFGGVMLLLLERLVLRPLARLDANVAAVQAADDLDGRVAVPSQPELGRLAGTINTMLDALQQVQRRVRESEARYRAIVEDQTELICRWRPDHTLTFANSAYRRYFAALPEVDRATIVPAVLAEDRERVIASRSAPAPRAEGTLLEYRVALPDGSTRWQQWIDRPILDQEGRLVEVQSVGRDITERKQAEVEQLRRERWQLEAQRLDSLGRLAGGVAQYYNNLLAIVLGNSGLLLRELPNSSPLRPPVAQIDMATRRAADLTEQLLAYAGEGRFLVQPIDLNVLVANLAPLLRTSIGTLVTVEYELDASVLPIMADAAQIRRALLNLALNAAEAIGAQEGALRFRTGWQEVDRPQLEQMALGDTLAPGRYVCLEVADTGCGMDAATQASIFTPFFSTKLGGRGLGLAAVLGIVRGHRGALEVISALEQGTRVRILLPPTDGPLLAARGEPVELPAWQGSGTIVIVDGEREATATVATMLRQLGFTPLQARDGHEALMLLRADPFGVAAVLLDLALAQLNAEQTLHALRVIRPDLPILLMGDVYRLDVAAALADDELLRVLQKPVTAEALRDELRTLLEEL